MIFCSNQQRRNQCFMWRPNHTHRAPRAARNSPSSPATSFWYRTFPANSHLSFATTVYNSNFSVVKWWKIVSTFSHIASNLFWVLNLSRPSELSATQQLHDITTRLWPKKYTKMYTFQQWILFFQELNSQSNQAIYQRYYCSYIFPVCYSFYDAIWA